MKLDQKDTLFAVNLKFARYLGWFYPYAGFCFWVYPPKSISKIFHLKMAKCLRESTWVISALILLTAIQWSHFFCLYVDVWTLLMSTCLLPGINCQVSLRQIQEKCYRVIVLFLLGGLRFGVEFFFSRSCCIGVNRSRTATFGIKQSISAVVLHKKPCWKHVQSSYYDSG